MAEAVPTGVFSKATFDSIRMADAFQGLAVAIISEEFSVEKPETKMTFDELITELERANVDGTVDEFNMRLGPMLQQAIQQIMSEGQQNG
jgi:hypothetical protein